MKNSKKIFIVDYAYGFNANTCEPDYVSRLRSQAALRALKKYPQAHIILSAGMKEVTGDCGPLAQMIKDFLIRAGVPSERIYLNPKGHDTLSETVAAYDIVTKHGGGTVVCATSAFHMPRVWLIWFLRFGKIATIYTTSLRTSSVERKSEVIKIMRDSVRSLFRRM